jgi:phosphoribosylformylglycinamidine cyclo-ligase
MPQDVSSYEAAGVSLGEARRSLDAIRESVLSTYTPAVIRGFGAFGGMFSGQFDGIAEPVLVSSIDGVGTKTAVAAATGVFAGLGKDIVNHCVNDILVQGARPLFFLDYFGTSRLGADLLAEIVGGAADACRDVGCALIGGETAELPGVYCEGEFDLVGAIVGVVDRSRVLPAPNVGPGDLVVGLLSDGLHTNGFSLARHALFQVGGKATSDPVPDLGRSLGEELLRPHRCYFRALEPLLEEPGLIKGMAHITGGGLMENLPRVLGDDLGAVIERRAWTIPPIFNLIQEAGSIPDDEMFRVFNMGIGMAIICPSESAAAVVQRLNDSGENAMVIGELARGATGVTIA